MSATDASWRHWRVCAAHADPKANCTEECAITFIAAHGDQAERHPMMTKEAEDLRAEVVRLKAALLAEREACARVAEIFNFDQAEAETAREIATAIRARGGK